MGVGIDIMPLVANCAPGDTKAQESSADYPDFYARLPAFSEFQDAFVETSYRSLPSSWLIAICQIEAASQAVIQGRYRDVNIVCAAAISAVLNAMGDTEVPYVFSGDSASFAIPAKSYKMVAAALAGARTMARGSFRLNLRIGFVPVSDINAAGHEVRIGRYRLGKVSTAMFAGGGHAYAESLVRSAESYRLPADCIGDADFTGLECRWKPVEPTRGRMLTLIVQATDNNYRLYQKIYAEIDRLCDSQTGGRPARARTLRLSKSPRRLRGEWATRTDGKTTRDKFAYALRLIKEYRIGRQLFDHGRNYGPLNGRAYKDDIIRQMDFQRFDSMLRMIVDVTPERHDRIIAYLAELHAQGLIHYGVESGAAAHITCLTFNRLDNHIHFVDGAGGGYAKAGRALQEQIRASVLIQFHQDRATVASLT